MRVFLVLATIQFIIPHALLPSEHGAGVLLPPPQPPRRSRVPDVVVVLVLVLLVFLVVPVPQPGVTPAAVLRSTSALARRQAAQSHQRAGGHGEGLRQSRWRPIPRPSSVSPAPSELFSSSVQDLRCLIESYLTPLQKESFLTQDEVRSSSFEAPPDRWTVIQV